jgi:hypothetical protein
MKEPQRSPGPWIEGVFLPHGSADGAPAIYSDTRGLPLVVFDDTDAETAGNCRLMANADALLGMAGELADMLHRYAIDHNDDGSKALVKQARKLIRAATTPREET